MPTQKVVLVSISEWDFRLGKSSRNIRLEFSSKISVWIFHMKEISQELIVLGLLV
jgi:hypothetical protein